MKSGIIQHLFAFAPLILFGCASTQTPGRMSATDESRYKQAIEEANAGSSPDIREGEVYTVAVGESAAQYRDAETDANHAATTRHIDPSRKFTVPKTAYDDFFKQSPAAVLSRMTLDPIVDGGTLLGYRVLDLIPFPGVDLANEDIVIGIGSKLPKNPDDYFDAWQSCKAASACTVNIQRGVDRFELQWERE